MLALTPNERKVISAIGRAILSNLIRSKARMPRRRFVSRSSTKNQNAYPNRQSVAVVGDGGFAMLMAELTTAVQYNLAVTMVALKNNSLSEVRFEQALRM